MMKSNFFSRWVQAVCTTFHSIGSKAKRSTQDTDMVPFWSEVSNCREEQCE